MKYFVAAFVIMISLSIPPGWLHAQQQIVISSFQSEPVTEIAKQIMMDAYSRLGIKMILKLMPTERALHSANNGDCDGELHRKDGINKNYPDLIKIPVPLLSVDLSTFSKKIKFQINNWDSLKPYTVGYQRGIKIVELNLPKSIRAQSSATTKQLFMKLDSGRVDIVVHGRLVGLNTVNKLGLKDIIVLEPPLHSVQLFHYVNVKNKNLIQPITTVLRQMKKNGVMRNIQKHVVR